MTDSRQDWYRKRACVQLGGLWLQTQFQNSLEASSTLLRGGIKNWNVLTVADKQMEWAAPARHRVVSWVGNFRIHGPASRVPDGWEQECINKPMVWVRVPNGLPALDDRPPELRVALDHTEMSTDGQWARRNRQPDVTSEPDEFSRVESN